MTDKLELIVADRDAEFLRLLAHYIRDTDWSRRLTVRQVTRPEMLPELIRSRPAMLVLVHVDFGDIEPGGACRIRLCEMKREAEDTTSEAAGIYKYQPLHQLLGRMMELYRAGSPNKEQRLRTEGASIYSVFSASGGAGKTTVAVHLARALADRGGRCLYWSMELVPAAIFPQEADAELTARFVYGLRSDAAWAADCLPGLVYRADSGIDYFPGFRKAREALELTRDDVGKLVACLRRTGNYDAVVFDLEATMHDRVLGALAESEAIVWLVTEDGQSAERTGKLLAELEELRGPEPQAGAGRGGIRLVMNKHTGFDGHMLPIPGGAGTALSLPIAVKLPYVSGWKQSHGARRQRPEPLFEAGMARLAETIRSSEGGDGFR
ncbi:hypothetical protein ACFFNY_27150 [Paenibacillus hodogayensis]|uniref:CobQ/CobB/MinD/ParA nucleotide binding domain-containing protein n=1 Tax=Paenibacillus hodogayensis TaxID=279208 RepID=A0ABV5W3W6_9BACL